jgi:predicted deacetylase
LYVARAKAPVALSRQLLIAVHDVTPAHADRVARIIDLLANAEVGQYALFVVPQWHGGWTLDEHRDFVALLRQQAAAGSEIFLHGLRHDEQGTRRAWYHQVRAFGRTDGEAEFLALPPAEAGARMDRGLEIFRAAGLEPVGFVPPAWLHGRDWSRLMRERRLAYTENSWAVFDVTQQVRLRASAFCWSTVRRWHETAGALIAAARLRVQARAPLLRVAIHPPDIDSRPVRESLQRVLRALLIGRRALSYRALFSHAGAMA